MDNILWRFCMHNIRYAVELLEGLAWFMLEKKGNYMVMPKVLPPYQYAITLDSENTPLPPAVHFEMLAKLSYTNYKLGCDLNISNIPQKLREFGKKQGIFENYELLENSTFCRGWSNLVKLAIGMLSLEMDILALYGMFGLAQEHKPVLVLEYDLLKASVLNEPNAGF